MRTLSVLAFAVVLAGCTTTTTTEPVSQNSLQHFGETDVYTKAEMQKTGREQVGPALAQLDPEITVVHH